jgi:hypothetical protein
LDQVDVATLTEAFDAWCAQVRTASPATAATAE